MQKENQWLVLLCFIYCMITLLLYLLLSQTHLPSIQSYKFLSLLYQLAARMSLLPLHDEDLFQPTLDKLIERTTVDHPHHSLFIILALANANKDQVCIILIKTTCIVILALVNANKDQVSLCSRFFSPWLKAPTKR